MSGTAAAAKRRQRSPIGLRLEGGSRDARQIAAVILEALAGERLPSDAAEAVGISLQSYYKIEGRAIEGLIQGCERKAKGRRRHPDREIAALRKQIQRLEHECARRQALLRAAQRAVGLTAAPAKPKGKRKRRPTRRALKAAAVLRSEQERDASENLPVGDAP